MTKIEKERKFRRDRIAQGVEHAIDELVKREDPGFYQYHNGNDGNLLAALVIFAVRRRSEDGAVIEAVSHSGDSAELQEIWKGIREMASEGANWTRRASDGT